MAGSREKGPHYSPTQLTMYERCGIQYRNAYGGGGRKPQKAPPGFALIRGASVHKGREFNMKQKIDSGVDLPLSAVTDLVRDHVDSVFRGEVKIDDDLRGKPMKEVRGKCIDVSTLMAETDYEHFQRPTQPLKVEWRLAARIPGLTKKELVGYIDLFDILRIIRDLKTKGKAASEKAVHSDEQLTFYYLLARMNGIEVAGLQQDVVTEAGGHDPIRTQRDDADLQAILNRIATTVKAIEAEIFIPCDTGNWMCDPKWCGYWWTCEYAIGRKRGGQG